MTSALHPPDRRFWVQPDMIPLDRKGLPSPAFTVHETARLYFGMSSSWLRVKMRRTDRYPLSQLVLDSQPMEIRRKYPDKAESARLFVLSDIEPMAFSLRDFEAEETEAKRKDMVTIHAAKSRALAEKQRTILARSAPGSKQHSRLVEAHANQRTALNAAQAHQMAGFDQALADLDRKLRATIMIVRGEAQLHGILDEDGRPVRSEPA